MVPYPNKKGTYVPLNNVDRFAMTQCGVDEEREDRIRDEAIVDAHGAEEHAIGWYYFLEARIQFPLNAKCSRRISTSPLLPGQRVTAIAMADVDICEHDIFVTVLNYGINIDVPLIQLEPQDASGETEEAIYDWHYWIDRGYSF